MSTTPKILNPIVPGDAFAAMSLSDEGAEHPYMTLFYTINEGTITFFGLRVMGTVEEKNEEGEDIQKIVYYGATECSTTNPNEAVILAAGTLIDGELTIFNDSADEIVFANPDEATDFIQVIRFVYNLAAQ
jgi:hypothetical protein